MTLDIEIARWEMELEYADKNPDLIYYNLASALKYCESHHFMESDEYAKTLIERIMMAPQGSLFAFIQDVEMQLVIITPESDEYIYRQENLL